jgi:acyl-coenzyme A synthetase/AMP-(fatty) acid ligase
MSAFSDYLENALLNHILRNTAMTSPSEVYVALFTSATTGAGGGTEVSGGGYARQQVSFNAPSNGSVTNSADVTFPEATADWGTISHFAIYDAATNGNMLFHGALDTAKNVNTGDVFKFPAGAITITLD